MINVPRIHGYNFNTHFDHAQFLHYAEDADVHHQGNDG